jgi:insertion element IS1 protein InsB
LIAWEVGQRDSATLQNFLDKVKGLNIASVGTDALHLYPPAFKGKHHLIGKFATQQIERSNGRLRDYLARLARKTKAVSKSLYMLILSIKIFAHFHHQNNFKQLIPILS